MHLSSESAKLLTAVFLILSLSTVILTIAAENARDTAAWVTTFELTGQTHVDICICKDTK